MKSTRVAGIILVALVLASVGAAPAGPAPAAPVRLAATRALVARLTAAGRAEAAVTLTRSDPLGGPAETARGRLALETPDRIRLDFPASGERIAVRRDGGEWVQPAMRQVVRLKPEQTDLAAGLWEVFLKGGGDRFTERSTGGRRFVLTARSPEESLPGEIHVTLDARGLPLSLAMDDPAGGGTRYAFSGWRFTRRSGRAAFVLKPPPGYTVVDLP